MYITLKENETMQDLADRLSESFELVYGIAPVAYWYENLNENGRIKDIHFSGRMREILGYKTVAEFPDELNTLMTFTHPDDVQIMLQGAIDAGTGKTDRYNVQYRIRKSDGSYMWCNATGELVKDANGVTVGMYGAFIDVTAEVELQKNQEIRRRSDELIAGFTKEYEVAFLIDLRDGQYQVIREKAEMDRLFSHSGEFIPAFGRYAEIMVHPADREKIREMPLSPDIIRERLAVGGSWSTEFRSMTSGYYSWYRGTFTRVNEDEILVGFRNCDEEYMSGVIESKLMGEYDAIYIVDLERGMIRSARKSLVSRVGAFEGETEYRSIVMKFAETVAPQYRQDWVNFSDPGYMKRYMEKEDHREYVYELPETRKKMRRFSVDVLERVNGEASVLLFSFMGIDDERAGTIRLYREIAEQKARNDESYRIIGALSEDFICVNYIELHEDKKEDFTVSYRTSELLKKAIPEWEEEKNFSRKLEFLYKRAVVEEDRERFLNETRREYILKALENNDIYFVNTRFLIENRVGYYQLQFIAVRENETVSAIVAGIHSIDEQMKKELEDQKKLREALDTANIEAKRTELLYEIADAARWSYEISADGRVISSEYGRRAEDAVVIGNHTDPMSWIGSVHPDDREHVLSEFMSAVNAAGGKTPYEVTYRIMFNDGSYHWIKSSGRKLCRADGTAQLFGMSVNITEQMEEQEKKTEAQLNSIRKTLSMTFALSDQYDPIMVVDPETGEYDWLMSVAQDVADNTSMTLHGEDLYKNIGIDAASIIHEEDRAQFLAFYTRENMMKIAETGETCETENRWFIRSEGEYRWKYNKAVRMIGDDGKAFVVIGVIDTTGEKEKEKEQLAQKKLIEEQQALSDGLAREYHTVWLLEGSGEHRMHLYRSTGKKTLQGAVQIALDDPSYDPGIIKYVNDYVHEDDRERVLEATKFETVVRETPDVGTYVVSYKRYCDDKGNTDYHQMCYAKAVSKDGTVNYIFAYRDADKMLREQIAQQKRLQELLDRSEEANAKIREQAAFTTYFLEPYQSAYYVGLDDLSFQIYRRTERLDRDYPAVKSYIDSLDSYIDREVHPEDREEFRALTRPDRVRELLSEKSEFNYVFRSIAEDDVRFIRFQVIRGADSSHAAFGFRDVTLELAEQQETERLKTADVRLQHELLRSEVLNFMIDHDDDPIELLKNFAERLRVLINCDQVIYRDLEETRIMVNSPAIENTWSVPIEYCMQCEHFDAHHPMYKDGYTEMSNCQEGWQGIPVYHECPIKSSLTRLVYCDGEIAGYLAIHFVCDYHEFTDIERRTLEEFTRILSMSLSRYAARKESRDKKRFDILHEIINSGQWTFYLNPDNEILGAEFPDSLKRVINNDLEGGAMDWVMSVHPDEREAVTGAFYAALNDRTGSTPYDVVFRMADRNGEYHWYHSAGRIIRDADGNGEFFGIHIDISEQIEAEKQQQRQLEEALAMAQSANRAKTTFLNNMSHDIRTPMNAIIGFTGLAASHIDNRDQVRDYLSKISQSSEHLLSLINDVLDMSRIESGKMNIEEKPENLPDIIHTLRDIVQADIHSKRHDFFIDTVNVNDENIICDKLRLNQVLLNLLSNAIKYTAPGGIISMRIIEKAVKPSGYATFEFRVKDNGMGMEKEYLETIFDPFTRVKSSTVSGIQGTGLGMAITKNIVDMMGGRIDINSEIGKGTEMVVTFDFMLAEKHRETVTVPEFSGLRALVADDDSNTCISIAKMLKDIGMRDEWCTSGKEAVIRAQEACHRGDMFRVFIFDWMMPDMNGIETARRIRKVIGDSTPIIILTAYDWSDIEDEAREAGVTAFVSKPIFPSDLSRVLGSCLGVEEKKPEPEADEFEFSGRKILLVEDNELNREIATEILEENGVTVETADDGDVAVEKMRNSVPGDYDLILMDVQMPRMDGYEATRLIREMDNGVSGIPVIAMTANAFEEDRKAALDAGMDEHISKPINISVLKKTLARFFDR